MARGKGGLGRGLDSLFEDAAPVFESGAKVDTLPLREIEPDPEQPRKTFDEQALGELAASIAEHGLLQPIAVRPRPRGGYSIVAGERRWRACRMAGLNDVPVVIKEVSDEQAMELALVENLQREDLDPVEEATGIRELMTRCGLTQEQAAQKLGKSRSALANSLRLLNLPENVLELLKSGFINIGHAKVILSLPTPELQEQAAQIIAEHGLLQPIAVRPRPRGGYSIVAGERRWRACRMAGLNDVPVVIKEVSDEQAMELALVENLQREDLDPVEEATGIRELMTRCGLTQEQAAQKLGKSRSALANSLRLLNLPENVLELLKSGFINIGHAKVILSLPTPELQEQAAQIIADNQLNVRQAEALCKKLAKPAKEPREPQPRGTLPVEVEESLKQVLGSEVNVAYHDGKGRLTVHFYSDEQLRAFANLLGQYQNEE